MNQLEQMYRAASSSVCEILLCTQLGIQLRHRRRCLGSWAWHDLFADEGELQPLRLKLSNHLEGDYLAAWFDPYRNKHLPAWSYPPAINPCFRATDFPDISTFRALPRVQQLSWARTAQMTKDHPPDLPAEIRRLRGLAKRHQMPSVMNEMVLRSIEAKAILDDMKDHIDQALDYMRGVWMQP